MFWFFLFLQWLLQDPDVGGFVDSIIGDSLSLMWTTWAFILSHSLRRSNLRQLVVNACRKVLVPVERYHLAGDPNGGFVSCSDVLLNEPRITKTNDSTVGNVFSDAGAGKCTSSRVFFLTTFRVDVFNTNLDCSS